MTTLPVLGEIPARKEGMGDGQIVVSENKNDRITELSACSAPIWTS